MASRLAGHLGAACCQASATGIGAVPIVCIPPCIFVILIAEPNTQPPPSSVNHIRKSLPPAWNDMTHPSMAHLLHVKPSAISDNFIKRWPAILTLPWNLISKELLPVLQFRLFVPSSGMSG